jgi:DNA-binding response OmpR family regulator
MTSAAASPAGVAFCPCCGINLAAEQPVSIGPLGYDPRGDATWNGGRLPLTSAEHIVLGSLALAGGALVPRPTIDERLGYDGDHRVSDVYLLRVRRKLRAAGAPATVIENVRSRGYRINRPMLESLACS